MNQNDVHRRRTQDGNQKDVGKRVSFDETSIKGRRIEEFALQNAECVSKDNIVSASSDDANYKLEKHDIDKTLEHVSLARKFSKLVEDEFSSLVERGISEGLEDLKLYSSTSTLSDVGKDSLKDGKRIPDRSYGAFIAQFNRTKALLVNRFLRSIPIENIRHENQLPLDKSRITTLYVKNINRSAIPDYSNLIKTLSDEVKCNNERRNCGALSLKQSFSALVVCETRKIYKVFKVLSIDSRPILAVITSDSLSFFSYDKSTEMFAFEYSNGFENLLAAVIGPFSEIVIILDSNNDRFCFNTGISDSVASDVISHLEVAMRRWCLNSKRELNFNVAKIHDVGSMKVFHDTILDDNFTKNEQIMAQYSVWLQEDYVSSELRSGLLKEGYVMTKISLESSWSPTYVCLKSGVLYLFEKNPQRAPKFMIPLQSNVFKGCRILNDSQRPHSFEILLEGNITVNFGAADETEMMEWIRLLYVSELPSTKRDITNNDKKSSIVNCFVTLSNIQIILHRFPNHIIGRALLENVSTFTASNLSESYCLLELECREASDVGGDWMLYFASGDSCRSFCSKFAELCDNSSTNYQMEENRFFMRRSNHISAEIQSLWDPFFVTDSISRNTEITK